MEVWLALVTGLVSAIIYSIMQELYAYFRWAKTRKFFLSKISGDILMIRYYVADILNINPIYETEYEDEHLMDNEEFISEVKHLVINKEKFKKIDKALRQTKDRIETTRKEALIVPTITSKDFHAVDNFLFTMGTFLSSYYWLSEEDFDKDTEDTLKNKLVDVLRDTEKKTFSNNFLDNVQNYFWRKRRMIKEIHKKYAQKTEKSDDTIPF